MSTGPDIAPESVKGFLSEDEGRRLYELGCECGHLGPALEIGSYCGRSTLWLGSGCREAGAVLFAVDHHGGSEEHQRGEEYHDTELYDNNSGRIDSLPSFRRTLERAGLLDTVVPIVAGSTLAARAWRTPLSLVFIDGGHSHEAARADYANWSGHIVGGGVLAIHDIFFNPDEGGQAPREIYQSALDSGDWEALAITGTLGVLRRRKRQQ